MKYLFIDRIIKEVIIKYNMSEIKINIYKCYVV